MPMRSEIQAPALVRIGGRRIGANVQNTIINLMGDPDFFVVFWFAAFGFLAAIGAMLWFPLSAESQMVLSQIL
jgi:hypothetical protein